MKSVALEVIEVVLAAGPTCTTPTVVFLLWVLVTLVQWVGRGVSQALLLAQGMLQRAYAARRRRQGWPVPLSGPEAQEACREARRYPPAGE